MKRREFLKRIAAAVAGVAISRVVRVESDAGQVMGAELSSQIVSVTGSPSSATEKAVAELGGIKKFVRSGDKVLIKPNIAWDRTPEQAANTHPDVVATLVRLCRSAGASSVFVADMTCNPWRVTYVNSGIDAAVKAAGGTMRPPINFRKVTLPKTELLKEAEVLEEILDADVVINVPVAKVHGSHARVTISMKNWMGAVRDRGFFHRTDLNRCIAEISSFIRPAFVVVDATRVLLTNGPAGPGQTKVFDTVLAGTDFVALDAYAAKNFLGIDPSDVRHIGIAAAMGLGQCDLSKIKIRQFRT
jgi:uncharacterized protein (DUF362 family)